MKWAAVDGDARSAREASQHDRPSLRQRLRAGTAAEHQALKDALPISRNCAGSGVYRDHLRYLLAFHEVVEPGLHALAPLRSMVPDLSGRLKTPLLSADLGPWAAGPRPDPDRLPRPRSSPQGLGMLYVLEGATLGARSLLPRLRAAGILPGELGQRYLTGYGRHTARWWNGLLGALETVPAEHEDEAVAWAIATFAALRAWRSDWETRA